MYLQTSCSFKFSRTSCSFKYLWTPCRFKSLCTSFILSVYGILVVLSFYGLLAVLSICGLCIGLSYFLQFVLSFQTYINSCSLHCLFRRTSILVFYIIFLGVQDIVMMDVWFVCHCGCIVYLSLRMYNLFVIAEPPYILFVIFRRIISVYSLLPSWS